MAEPRSPGYPGIPLDEAIDLVGKIYAANRANPLVREAAVIEMGYTGLNGRSAKVLSDLSHFGLVEKAGSGSVRVTKLAVNILYPESDEARLAALHTAANNPALFGELNAHFSDGLPSENALRAYLMRNSFASAAIQPIMASYLETYRNLAQPIEIVGHGRGENSNIKTDSSKSDASDLRVVGVQVDQQFAPVQPQRAHAGVPLMDNERVIFVEEASAGQYLKLVATGQLDDNLLEALEDFTKRQRKRLGAMKGMSFGVAPEGNRPEESN
jgi:hypothetical protein